jgi:hypothetical protein
MGLMKVESTAASKAKLRMTYPLARRVSMPVQRRMFPPRAWTSSSLSMIYSDQPWSNQIPVTQVPKNGARTTTSRMRCLISVRGRNSPFSPLLNISARICVLSVVFESSGPQVSKARGLAGIALASLISLCFVVATESWKLEVT